MVSLTDQLVDRLAEHPLADEELLLGAVLGHSELEEALGGAAPERSTVRAARGGEADQGPAGAFLTSVTVQGFRGIGPSATLHLEPGPGLTVVCGRNGSGKSSFAEALEALLTGEVRRLEDRSGSVWRETWRCLHDAAPKVSASLTIEGSTAPASATRTWEPTAKLVTDGTTRVQLAGEPVAGIERLGWGGALALHRPFLSHAELEVMFARPSELYDQLNGLLGLEELQAISVRVADARKLREQTVKRHTEALVNVRSLLEAVEEPRAATALELLGAKLPDLDQLAALAAGGVTAPDPTIGVLGQWRALGVPSAADVDAAAGRLDEAAAALEEAARSDASVAMSTARLLEAATEHVRRHGAGDCPVCGTAGAIGPDWIDTASERIDTLRSQASAIAKAEEGLAAAVDDGERLVRPVPGALAGGPQGGVDPAAARVAWEHWALSAPPERTAAGARALAAHLRVTYGPLAGAVGDLSSAAASAWRERQDRWQPAATALGAWCEAEAEARAAKQAVGRLKKVEVWLKAANDDLRNERLAPYIGATKSIWAQLRQGSNVDIAAITLTGSNTRRAVDFNITVDDATDGTIGVLSQGEINSLALSVFLPRATAADSPLRFVVIDDPVQAMDPSKVDGLARVLSEVAADRQVVVFTHDDRLPDALRYLDLAARIVEVVRRADSVVEVHPCDDPAGRLVKEAGSLAAGEGVPAVVASRVVPNLCRTAVEEVCMQITRRRRLRRGDSHDQVDADLAAADRLTKRLALALLDDSTRGGEVYATLNGRIGSWATNLVKELNAGSHDGATHERLREMVGDTRKLNGRLIEAWG